MKVPLSELAERFGLRLIGDDVEVSGVAPLERATAGELSFLSNPKYADQLESTSAGAVIAREEQATRAKCPVLAADDPYLALARVLEVFHTPQGAFSGQSGLASVHADARVDDSAELAPFVYVGRGSVVGPRSRLFPGVYVGEDCVLGEGCVLYPGATLMAGVKLGDGVIVHPGAVLGSDGFGYAQGPEGHVKVPQIGGLEIGDRVEIGANTAIDRGSLGTTRIETGAKLDNLCQVAHNVTVGPHSILVSQVGVSGSTKLGTGVILGGQVGVVGHLTIGDGSMVGAQAGVGKDLPPGSQVSGSPAYDHKTFLRNAALMPKLPDMAKKVRELERELAEIKASLKKGDDHDG